jgi:competence protein ComEC
MRITKKKRIRLFLGALIAIVLIGAVGCAPNSRETLSAVSSQTKVSPNTNNPILKVTYLDVGQADSVLIQIPNGENILIDAGNNEDAEMIISFLKSQGISRLDSVIGTHPHEDHIGSLDKVIKNFQIGQVIMPKVTTNTQTFKDVLTSIQNKGLKIKEAKAGLRLEFESKNMTFPKVSAEVLAPKSGHYEDLNNYSVVLRLTYGQNVFLFTGDAENVSEQELTASTDSLKADILKVGHHGSSSSTTQEFLSKVSPRYAVISVGKDNTYGHPTLSTLNRLKRMGIKIYRTDEMGTIVAESNGNEITLKPSK